MNQLWPFKTDVRKHVVSPHTVIVPKDDSNIHKQEFDIDAVPAAVGRFLKCLSYTRTENRHLHSVSRVVILLLPSLRRHICFSKRCSTLH